MTVAQALMKDVRPIYEPISMDTAYELTSEIRVVVSDTDKLHLHPGEIGVKIFASIWEQCVYHICDTDRWTLAQ